MVMRSSVMEKTTSWDHQFSTTEPPSRDFHAHAATFQKVYNAFRTRRHLGDCRLIVQDLWWCATHFGVLRQSSVTFFDAAGKPETAVARWARLKSKASKLGKGLSKDKEAKPLYLKHWLEAVDPRHRYGCSLNLYHDVWVDSPTTQPFFYWLDIGDGKEVNLEKCPRSELQRQCVKYLGPREREEYEVILEEGKMKYSRNGSFVDSIEGTEWIYVLSPERVLYVAQKEKGRFHHSSFLAGGAAIAAGKLLVSNGVIKAVWPYSGHYRQPEENFLFIGFLVEHHIDPSSFKTYTFNGEERVMPSTFCDMFVTKKETDGATMSKQTSLKEADGREITNPSNRA
ncbi:PREDICTED: IQ domain-containing protein IQM5-like [Ipomoea nil]|uniref:IQ domain-containing protein IQM5-like n=1 Tax=Ipomoea nil TaxID=35883 RepID=UPI0009011A5E|nr:PREDICTED: IQ domain-containing protein IQM5-like [Ipomoea nil]